MIEWGNDEVDEVLPFYWVVDDEVEGEDKLIVIFNGAIREYLVNYNFIILN